MKLFCPLLCFLTSLHASAAIVTWQFNTVVDASEFGGLTETPLEVLYSFDNALPEGFGSSIDFTSSFGPATMHITLGAETVIATGAEIYLWNYDKNYSSSFPPGTDGYELNANIDAIGCSITGKLLGMDVSGVSFALYDNEGGFFTEKPDLPASPDFAEMADFQTTFIYFGISGGIGAPRLGPFHLSGVPEPSACFLAGASVGVFVLRRKRTSFGLFRNTVNE